MRASLRHALNGLRHDESGQSLVVVTACLAVVMGVCGFSIDAASWMVKHHRAQVVADSAALAAAHCLANPGQTNQIELAGSETSVPACTSATDTADADTVAVTYAAANGLTITASNISINTTNDTVTVDAPATSPGIFASMFGMGTTHQSAAAEAGWTAGSSSTCNASAPDDCSAVYAGNTACPTTTSPSTSQSPTPGLEDGTTNGGGATPIINGTVHSEGGIDVTNSGPTFNGTPPLTVAGSCYNSTDMPDYGKATAVASQPWPINYAASPYFTACTTSCTTVNGIANVPPYCTQATNSTTGYTFTTAVGGLPISGNVYCSIGTGTPSNPATWNGPIDISVPNYPSGGCGSSYPDLTFIGGNISFQQANGGGSTICISPQLDNCLMYATGNVNIYNGTFNWTGNIFDPTGTVQLGTTNAGGDSDTSASGMIEAWNVYLINVTLQLTGDGPIGGTTTTSTGGGDSLLQ